LQRQWRQKKKEGEQRLFKNKSKQTTTTMLWSNKATAAVFVSALSLALTTVDAFSVPTFAPLRHQRRSECLRDLVVVHSTISAPSLSTAIPANEENVNGDDETGVQQQQQPEPASFSGPLSGEEINRRLEAQLVKMREKDRQSPLLSEKVSVCDA
jgi:hypothetical protein